MFTLSGRTAVVSGGGGGVGLEIVKGFLENGMNVAILSSTEEKGESARQTLSENIRKNCIAFGCHVDKPNEVEKTFNKIYETFHSIDVIVNGAGMHGKENIYEIDYEQWTNAIENLMTSTFVMCKTAIPYLEKSKAPRIINLSTVDARCGGIDEGICPVAGKGGNIAMTKALAKQLAIKKITVNSIAVGLVEGDLPYKRNKEELQLLSSKVPLGYLASPKDIAPAAWFLASEEASYVTGAVIDVNGGLYMG